MKKRWPGKRYFGYALVLTASLLAGVLAGWTSAAHQVDNSVYDWMCRLHPPAQQTTHSAIVAIDDATFSSMGGMRGIRSILTQSLNALHTARPRVVAIDLLLCDPQDQAEDARLARAMAQTKNVVLSADLVNDAWEDPEPLFRAASVAVGHAEADVDSPDGVQRQLPLEIRAGRERHWALALEAYRVTQNARILESPEDVAVGANTIPVRFGNGRPLRILYTPGGVPEISAARLIRDPSLANQFDGKAVFIGVTSQSAARDRAVTQYGPVPGVQVHAAAFETLERGAFFSDASNLELLGICALIAVLAGLIFGFLGGWPAYIAAALLMASVHVFPFMAFRYSVVFPYVAPAAVAWLTVAAAATYQHFVIRRQLRKSEADRSRYQQAIQFVTHEMRTPLTAIQGSSELIGRYNLNDDKRRQIADVINSESKRLARMIQTFLDVERLSDGQIELKQEQFDACDLVSACVQRARPLADRKNIEIHAPAESAGMLNGDRELMEYAVYNLLTNSIKYSPSGTEIAVSSHQEGREIRLSVRDQGIGMNQAELKQIFKKFYRTQRAETSGEVGTGIGLSIVEQIVIHHGGHMEVTSTPGQGSCFTMILPALTRATAPVST